MITICNYNLYNRDKKLLGVYNAQKCGKNFVWLHKVEEKISLNPEISLKYVVFRT